MAELVAAVGVPHSPHYPSQFPKDGPQPTSEHFRKVKKELDAARPDALIVIANDHFNTFFLNNFPTFAIGVAETSSGPNDQTKMPHYDLTVHSALASHLRKTGIGEGFDFAVTQEFGVDHAVLVPLHYLTDGVRTPVVPLWVNAFVKPVLKFVTFPLALLTLGIAWFFVALFILWLTSAIVSGFHIDGFWTLVGATIVVWAVGAVASHWLFSPKRD